MNFTFLMHRWAMLVADVNCSACGFYNPRGSVACAHCSLTLPGTANEEAKGDAKGAAVCAAHAGVQAVGTCTRCGIFGCATCLSPRGSSWLCASCLQLSELPWDQRETLGIWRAWWRTSVLMISAPYQTLQSARPDAPLGSSIFFAMLSALVGLAPSFMFMVPWTWLTTRASHASELPEVMFGQAIGSVVGTFFVIGFLLLYQLGALLLFSGLEHLALAAVGGQPKSYSVTVRGHALAMGAYLIGLLPLCSLYVYPLWSMVLRVFAMNVFHRTTPGRAAAAVLLPVGLLCGAGLALYVAVIALAVGASR